MKILRVLFLALCAFNLNAQQVRSLKTINAGWKFQKSTQVDVAFTNQENGWQSVNVPHCFNSEDAEDDVYGIYKGIGWYKKDLTLDSSYQNKQIFLYFEGANLVTELFVNGVSAGVHLGGYASFSFDITKLVNLNAKNIIAVRVDNSDREDVHPYSADFTFLGGIYRDVFLVATNKVHFDMTDKGSSGVFISTPSVSESKAVCDIRATLLNESVTKQALTLRSVIKDADGKTVVVKDSKYSLAAGQKLTVEQKNITVKNPNLWSPDSPYLYAVFTQVCDAKGNVIDEVKNNMGFRWFSFDADKGFTLNGKSLKLIGVNRHQSYTKQGNALSDEQHVNDVKLIKEMGGNCLRIAHYQQDPAILEACDRLGLITEVEIPIVNYINEDNEQHNKNCVNMAREMVRRDFNHPSVMIWAYMNEVLLHLKYDTDAEKDKRMVYYSKLCKLATEIENTIRKEDPYRYTMIPHAMMYSDYKESGLLNIAMINGWNLYQGWYGSKISDFGLFLDQFHKEYPKSPFLITEYGAGSDFRIRSFNPVAFDFSMEYQNMYHEGYIKAMQERPFCSGGMVWNFIDFLSENRKDITPHINNKGLVTQTREKKDAYYLYQAALLKTPVVAIPSKTWRFREASPAKANENFCTQKVEVFSNQSEVELFQNGKSLGKKKIEEWKASWEVPFTAGENILEAVANDNGKLTKDFAKIEFTFLDFPLNKNKAYFPSIHVNAGASYFYNDERNHCNWLPDQPYIQGSWGYIDSVKNPKLGGRPSTFFDILLSKDEPLLQSQRSKMEAYRFDVPDGTYDIELTFAELMSEKQMKKSLYNIMDDATTNINIKREFDVNINGTNVLKNFNIKETFGELTAAPIKFQIEVRDGKGISIDFKAIAGVAVVNAISVVRIK